LSVTKAALASFLYLSFRGACMARSAVESIFDVSPDIGAEPRRPSRQRRASKIGARILLKLRTIPRQCDRKSYPPNGSVRISFLPQFRISMVDISSQSPRQAGDRKHALRYPGAPC